MEFLKPVDLPSEVLGIPKVATESGQPQPLNDEPQQVSKMLGRQNVSYQKVWDEVDKLPPEKWLPIKCNSYRRALLLASAAIQHRTKAYEVSRKGRMVCIRRVHEPERAVAV